MHFYGHANSNVNLVTIKTMEYDCSNYGVLAICDERENFFLSCSIFSLCYIYLKDGFFWEENNINEMSIWKNKHTEVRKMIS